MNSVFRHSLIALSLTVASPLALIGCGEDVATDSANADAHRILLASVADNVIIPLTESFVVATADLQLVTSALAGDPSDANWDSARQRWASTMTLWQQLEVLQVGPAGLMGVVAGGENLRDAIYSWPTVNTCRVDQETARATFTNPATLTAALVNVRGLDALEHLLFTTATEHSCSIGSAFATSGEWEAIGDDAAVAKRRADHAAALAGDLAASAQKLRDAWSPIAGAFRDTFAKAGQDKSSYATAQEALNALSDAMFYLEKETKDMKLAIPAGVAGCETTTCVEARENAAANVSKRSIVANVDGFRRVFTGGLTNEDNPGFDDLLSSMGQEALATRLVAELNAAKAAVDGLQGTLAEAIAATPAEVVAAYEVLRIPIQTFRTEVLSVLDLELPQRAEGDND